MPAIQVRLMEKEDIQESIFGEQLQQEAFANGRMVCKAKPDGDQSEVIGDNCNGLKRGG